MNQIKIFILAFSLFSCALFIPGLSEYNKAKKYYNNRSYDLAVEYSYSSLLKKIDNEKAIQLFELSFTSAVNSHNSALSSLFKIEDDSKWPEIVKEYKSLMNLNNIIKELKPLLERELSYSDAKEKLNSFINLLLIQDNFKSGKVKIDVDPY